MLSCAVTGMEKKPIIGCVGCWVLGPYSRLCGNDKGVKCVMNNRELGICLVYFFGWCVGVLATQHL